MAWSNLILFLSSRGPTIVVSLAQGHQPGEYMYIEPRPQTRLLCDSVVSLGAIAESGVVVCIEVVGSVRTGSDTWLIIKEILYRVLNKVHISCYCCSLKSNCIILVSGYRRLGSVKITFQCVAYSWLWCIPQLVILRWPQCFYRTAEFDSPRSPYLCTRMAGAQDVDTVSASSLRSSLLLYCLFVLCFSSITYTMFRHVFLCLKMCYIR